jgi:hypothetical protein
MNGRQRSEIGDQGSATSSPAEETLRLIARLSPPEGLEERVQAGLRAKGTVPGRARILQWPMALRLDNFWMQSSLARMAAACNPRSQPGPSQFPRAPPRRAGFPAPEPCAPRKSSTAQSSNLQPLRIRPQPRRPQPRLPARARRRRRFGMASLR